MCSLSLELMVDHPTDQVQLALSIALPLFLIIMLVVFSWTVIFPLLTFYATAFGANLFTLGLLGQSHVRIYSRKV